MGPRTWQALLIQKNKDEEKNEAEKNETPSNLNEENPVQVSSEDSNTKSEQLVSIALEYGAEGIEVSKLQQNLRSLGYFDGPTITGYFGPATKAAIIRFQLAEKLIATIDDKGAGDLTEKTKDRMIALLLGKKTAAPVPEIILTRGNKNVEVKILQEKLQKIGLYNGPLTDFYGEQTESAVKEFQKKYNVQSLSADKQGVFETKTATRLDQVLGMDISLSPTFIRYIEPFTLVTGKLQQGN